MPHDRERYITRMAQVDYDPAAKAPVWEAFIQSVTGGDAQLAEYLQVMVGYCLCGSTREQCMIFSCTATAPTAKAPSSKRWQKCWATTA